MKKNNEKDEVFLYQRPVYIDDFVGQDSIIKNLRVFINAAKHRGDSLDHVLLCGPPGLGKTTLAQIISKELDVGFRPSVGPLLNKAGDLAAIISNLQDRDVFFLDEIHRLNKNIEEVLYSAMEDYHLDIVVGEGSSARNIRLELSRFTLVGATTRAALLSAPLRDRFGIVFYFDFYEDVDIAQVLVNAAKSMGFTIDLQCALFVAQRSRGTPRGALRFLRRVRDFADVEGLPSITYSLVKKAFKSLGVDCLGLLPLDIKYLEILNIYNRPVGISTIAVALSEDVDNIENTLEPYLIRINFIDRTASGRILTAIAKEHLDKNYSTHI